VVTGASSCSALDSANPLLTDSYYVNNTHFGMAAVMFKPVKRVTTQGGYSITRVDGRSPIFNVLQPDGSLRYSYHQPVAQMSLDQGHNLSWNAGWNYSQHGERVAAGPAAPRYFHANNATLSLHYSF